jgi:hypothetical protein
MLKTRIVRTWIRVPGRTASLRIDSIHPQYGLLYRGRLAAVDVAPTNGPGPAGTLVWHGTDYDAYDLGRFTGNLVDAQRWLLEQTAALDETDPPARANPEAGEPSKLSHIPKQYPVNTHC